MFLLDEYLQVSDERKELRQSQKRKRCEVMSETEKEVEEVTDEM